ncbi:hypothetical protein [Pantoea sp. 18069]|uniref:hypothetical protein n=1 Tax=Pantoea sp. 18069 TaxID=2681415 RepID=UPI001359A992|nr:hypothetical protein [Pantoea sp. 18069]
MSAFFAPLHRPQQGMRTPGPDAEVLEGPASVPQARLAGLREQAICYALSRHVPDMAHGFVVSVNHAEWQVSGELACRIASLVREALMDELARTE